MSEKYEQLKDDEVGGYDAGLIQTLGDKVRCDAKVEWSFLIDPLLWPFVHLPGKAQLTG